MRASFPVSGYGAAYQFFAGICVGVTSLAVNINFHVEARVQRKNIFARLRSESATVVRLPFTEPHLAVQNDMSGQPAAVRNYILNGGSENHVIANCTHERSVKVLNNVL